MRLSSLACVILAIMWGISCEESVPEPISVVSIEQEFEVFPTQMINEEGLSIQLVIRNLEADTCINATLDANMTINASMIRVNYGGTDYPENCERGEIHLEKAFDIPLQNSIYDIEFLRGNELSTSGTLLVDDEKVILDIENLGSVFVSESSINRIPQDAVWGYLSLEGLSSSDPFLLEEQSELEAILEEFEYISEGEYEYFIVRSSGEVYVENMPDNSLGCAYIIKHELDPWVSLQKALSSVIEKTPDLKYYFMNTNGDILEN